MKLLRVKKLNPKEINNRLSNVVFPQFRNHLCHFTNDIIHIKDYLIPYLVQNALLNDVLNSMSEDKIDEENFNLLFCQHSLLKIIGEANDY